MRRSPLRLRLTRQSLASMSASPISSPPRMASSTSRSTGSYESGRSRTVKNAAGKPSGDKCLEKRGVPKDKLPSTSSATGQRLMRHVKQSINRAVTLCFEDHEGCQFAYEQLSVASMKFKARSMNAYMRASNLGHIPDQIA